MNVTSLHDPATGLYWTVRLLTTWEHYGREHVLQHTDDEPVVEFYDAEYEDNPFFVENNAGYHWGQFVSSYKLSTFMAVEGGINLHGGVPKWTVSREAVQTIQAWIKEIS